MTVDPNEIEAPEDVETGKESQDTGEESGEGSQEVPPHSHVLTLANGSTHYYDAADGEPNGPVPTEIDGVPVVHVAHAGEGI